MSAGTELPLLQLVVVGHVDHGKSTVIGRLLADTGSLPDGKLEQVKDYCARNARPFEYAYLLDALKDERSQGITIETARIFFNSAERRYLIHDAPGHTEFLKNMITGAARAEAALLVIDIREGLQENSFRHGYLLGLLGVRQVSVLINKMDLVDYRRDVYDATVRAYGAFLERIGLEPVAWIPVAGLAGDNITSSSERLDWYQGPTVLEQLDRFIKPPQLAELPLRLPVQDVYKFTNRGDQRRIVAGTLASGRLQTGDELVFYPSGKTARIQRLESLDEPNPTSAEAGEPVGLTLDRQIYVRRGEWATLASEAPPAVSSRLRVSLFWLGERPLVPGRDYIFKLGTARVYARLETVEALIQTADLSLKPHAEAVARHEVADCVFQLRQALVFEPADVHPTLSRFVLIDQFEISGGGIIREALPDRQQSQREQARLRNRKWEYGLIGPEQRAARFLQQPALILISGPRDSGKKPLAKALEQQLFELGHSAYYLGIGSVRYGLDADLAESASPSAAQFADPQRDAISQDEHLRRLAEIAYILLDAGQLLIVTAVGLSSEALASIQTALDPAPVLPYWIGPGQPPEFRALPQHSADASTAIRADLEAAGLIFKEQA